jgi:hypothetical protein
MDTAAQPPTLTKAHAELEPFFFFRLWCGSITSFFNDDYHGVLPASDEQVYQVHEHGIAAWVVKYLGTLPNHDSPRKFSTIQN